MNSQYVAWAQIMTLHQHGPKNMLYSVCGVWISKIQRGTALIKTWENNHLFQSDLDGNKSAMQMKTGSISRCGGVNKKPWCLLYALRKAKLVYSESHKGNPPTRECFTKPSLEMWLNVLGSGGWGPFSSTFMSYKERRETGLGFVTVIQRDEIGTWGQEHWHKCNLCDPQWQN